MRFDPGRREALARGHDTACCRSWRRITVFLTVAAIVSAGAALCQDTTYLGQRIGFRSAIGAFLEADRTQPPPEGAILFIGSSIFREWTHLREQMAPLPVFNRAFGGSRTAEVLYYMDRIVLPYRPRIIVYYCGSNDINAGEKAPDIADRFRLFAARVYEALPGTQIYYVSINRAPQKRARWAVVDLANGLVKAFCDSTRHCQFIDVNPILFDSNNNPRLELYRDDQLHFKEGAYEEFTAVLKPILMKAWSRLQ